MMLRSLCPARPRLTARALGVLGAAALGTLVLGALPAEAAQTTQRQYSVRIGTPSQSPHVGERFAIKGSVTPAADGERVELQRSIGGTFQTIAKDRLNGSSSYRFAQTGQTVAGYTYRVVAPAKGHLTRGVSPVRRVWVTGDTLRSGPVMRSHDSLISADGSYRLTMQATGNLAILLTSTGRLIWSMQTSGHPGAWAVLQRDGNLVVHAAGGVVLKSTGTGGRPNASYALRIREDSNLAIYRPGTKYFWSSNTTNTTLGSTESLRGGQFLRSADRRYQLVMRYDGNLVLYDTSDASIDWASNTGTSRSSLVMRADGDMLIVGAFGRVLWSAGTDAYPGATALLQTDGNFVVRQKGVVRWTTRGHPGVLGDDYPAYLREAPRDALIDPWRFYNRECTSFVAWRMNSANRVAFSNFMSGGRFGNADTWDDNARALGYVVNSTPARGAIAESDKEGHVAWVASVAKGTVTIEDYNYSSPGGYGSRTVPTSTYIYIHVKDM